MKLQFPLTRSRHGARPSPAGGFTLAEVLVAMTVFVLLVGGVVFANLFGLRMFQITETKLNATDGARKTVGRLTDEIRSCQVVTIGNVKTVITNGVTKLLFEGLLDGETQAGAAIEIQPTTNSTPLIYYFVKPSDETFRRTTSSGDETILAESVTNAVVFHAQNLSGKVLTNNQPNPVIHLKLDFYQPQRFMQLADSYRLETSVTRRASE